MWKKDKYHHQKKVSSFNPAWCLLPPPTRVAAVTPRSNNSHQKSVVASAFHAKKALVQYRQSQKVEIKEEPTSPRVGCMGQIRLCKTSRSATAAVVPMSRSWSAVTPPAPPAASVAAAVVPRLENMMKLKGLSLMRVVESVEGMDPPRPVEKKEVREENLISLWKRRCCEGGRGGEGLQLELRQQRQQQIC